MKALYRHKIDRRRDRHIEVDSKIYRHKERDNDIKKKRRDKDRT